MRRKKKKIKVNSIERKGLSSNRKEYYYSKDYYSLLHYKWYYFYLY